MAYNKLMERYLRVHIRLKLVLPKMLQVLPPHAKHIHAPKVNDFLEKVNAILKKVNAV